jgi:ADP-heptose:LPS heptosyltransferase
MAIAALKPLERRLRHLLLSRQPPFTGTLITRPEEAINLRAAPRILLVRPERIGDVLIAVPVIRAIRRRYPHALLDLLLSTANAGVQPAVSPWVDRVLIYEKHVGPTISLVRKLRRTRYDLMVDLVNEPSVTSRFIAKWSGAERVLGMLHEQPGLFTHAVPLLDRRTVHIVDRTAQLLLAFGIDPATESLALEYPLSEADRLRAMARLAPSRAPFRLGVNVSGRGPAKYWGRENFVEAIRAIQALDPRFSVTVCGGVGYDDEIDAIAGETGVDKVRPLDSFHEFAAVINACDLLLTPDTSVVHLAAAWRIPMVGLYRADARTTPWLPYGTPHRAIVHEGPLAGVSLIRVMQAMTALIEECFGPTWPPDPRGPGGGISGFER